MKLLDRVHPEWRPILLAALQDSVVGGLSGFLAKEYSAGVCYPAKDLIFRAFEDCGPMEVKCVILGQDPFINQGQAHGLAFSVQEGCQAPPSLQNIFKEIATDSPGTVNKSGSLAPWARNGCLLLNSILTVRAGQSGSHRAQGWENATGAILSALGRINPRVVYLLWGNYARQKRELIQTSLKILEAAHPSPLSAHNGFFGCKHFSQTNQALIEAGLEPMDWST